MSLEGDVAELKALCNKEIAIATRSAYRLRPHSEVINPDVPFIRVNELLKACDKVFAHFRKA